MKTHAVRGWEVQPESAIELKSAPWQWIVATLVFGFIGFFAVGAIVGAFSPQAAWVDTTGSSPVFLFASGMATLGFCIFSWLRSVAHHLYADEEGIVEKTGVRTKRVRWSDVSFYRLERVRGTQERLKWPVLYDAEGRELLRPAFPFIVGTRKQDRERAAFWRYVEERLEGQRRELPPPKPLPKGVALALIVVMLVGAGLLCIGFVQFTHEGSLSVDSAVCFAVGSLACIAAWWTERRA